MEQVNGDMKPGESIRKSLWPPLVRLLLPLTLTLVTIILLVFSDIPDVLMILPILLIPRALYRFLDWRNDCFQVTEGYVETIYKKPFGFNKTRRRVELTSIQDIRTEQKSFWANLFRFGDVIVMSAGNSTVTFRGVAEPWSVQETLFRLKEEKEKRSGS